MLGEYEKRTLRFFCVKQHICLRLKRAILRHRWRVKIEVLQFASGRYGYCFMIFLGGLGGEW